MLLSIYFTEPFVVGFVQTAYTVVESIGSVEVCINLTRPHIDILDESVNAFVTDFPTSVYIPAGAPLACKSPPVLKPVEKQCSPIF